MPRLPWTYTRYFGKYLSRNITAVRSRIERSHLHAITAEIAEYCSLRIGELHKHRVYAEEARWRERRALSDSSGDPTAGGTALARSLVPSESFQIEGSGPQAQARPWQDIETSPSRAKQISGQLRVHRSFRRESPNKCTLLSHEKRISVRITISRRKTHWREVIYLCHCDRKYSFELLAALILGWDKWRAIGWVETSYTQRNGKSCSQSGNDLDTRN